jgi:DNA-binding transcriptional MerR regulator
MNGHTIGEVLNRLKEDFDDVTISKIRFLESEGLIAPERSESGYRQFSDSDVDRLRYVLRAQRDRYLPLKVIRDELARLDAGLPVEPNGPEAPSGGGEEVPVRPSVVGSLSDVVLDLHELAHASGLRVEQANLLVRAGVLRAATAYDGDDLAIAKVAAELIRRGLEPRHLRGYRLSADREEGLITQLVGPLLRQRNPESRRQAERRADELAELGSRLHHLLLQERLRATLRS